jgi:hypothetical protein
LIIKTGSGTVMENVEELEVDLTEKQRERERERERGKIWDEERGKWKDDILPIDPLLQLAASKNHRSDLFLPPIPALVGAETAAKVLGRNRA